MSTSPTPATAATHVACDIGGTFTDFVQVDAASGKVAVHKCLTTPVDPSEAVESGVRALARATGASPAQLRTLIHGTTLVINAVIERKGARTGLVTTAGFRDLLEIGREKRFDGNDLRIRFPEPLVERPLRLEVAERMHASGRVLQPLDETGARAVIRELVARGVQSIAVCLLNAYANPAHERRVAEIAAEVAPGVPVSVSADVWPEIKEYERFCTTVVNAYAKPVVSRYLGRIEERLGGLGFAGQLLLMQSNGGICSPENARRFPVQIIESGPAAGAIGAAHYAQLAGIERILAFDMGGTTAKMCLVAGGHIARTRRFEVDRVHRFKRGSGIPIRVPVVDLMEIGAGGGSIAHVSRVGTLQVGPQSASADPGPACYGRGGSEPTVSDADLVLGYLSEDYFLGGAMRLDRQAAEAAIERHVAGPLKLTVQQAAWGIHGIVNENMASAAKVYVTEKGESPASCVLVAFGGAGPLHAADLARRIGIRRLLVPPRAGVASAFGMMVAPMSYDTVRTCRARLADADLARVESLFDEMKQEALAGLPRGVDPAQVRYTRGADMRYVGQGYEAEVPLPDEPIGSVGTAAIQAAFDRTYRTLYGRVFDDIAVELVNFRLTAVAPRAPVQDAPAAASADAGRPHAVRPAYCPIAARFIDHAVYRRSALGPGIVVDGPAIVEEPEATTIMGSGSRLEVDAQGCLLVTLQD